MTTTVSAFDVAAALRARLGAMGDVRLHKLVYYVQAWHLAWFGCPAFDQAIEAWKMGPVVVDLWRTEKYGDVVPGDPAKVTDSVVSVIKFVVANYGTLNGIQLSDLAHRERPWKATREALGIVDGVDCSAPITHGLMGDFYRTEDGADQAWYWSKEWLEGEAEAAAELNGGDREALTDDEFFQSFAAS